MKGRLHFFHALRCLRYGLFLCLVPLARALLTLQLQAFFTALQQDLLILLVLGFLSVYTWLGAGFALEGEELTVTSGFFFRHTRRCRLQDLAACELRRTLLQRLCGAARLTVYLRSRRSCGSLTMLVSYKQALALQEALFALPKKQVQYRPSRGEWLLLLALSTNLAAEGALVVGTVNRVQNFLGTDFSGLAISRLEQVLAAANLVLPAGLSLLLSLVLLFTLCSLAISALRVGGFRVGRAGGLLVCRGGLCTVTEQRIRMDCVNSIDVRRTLLSRVTGFDAVYLCAGGFTNRDTPLLFFKRSDPAVARQLLPEMALPYPLPRYERRNPWQFLWLHGSVLAVWTIFLPVAARVLPGVLPVLWLLCALQLALLAVQLEAYYTEGYAPQTAGRVCLGYSRRLTRHFVTVFLRGCQYQVSYSSLSIQEDRGNLSLTTPAGRRLIVRGICKSEAGAWVAATQARPSSKE